METRRTNKRFSQLNKKRLCRRLRLEPLEDRRMLAVVTVDTHLDTVDFFDGATSLREAVFATNLVGGADTIDFDADLSGKTILLTMGELPITDSLIIDASGLTGGLTIDASGSDPMPDENYGDGSRIFNIDDGNSLTDIHVELVGLTLTGGDVGVWDKGGAIRSEEYLSVINSTITGNSAGYGGGGGIWAGNELHISGSTISGNTIRTLVGLFFNGYDGGDGGGIWSGSSLTIAGSTIFGNAAGDGGPAFYKGDGGDGGDGGGIWATGSLSIIDTTISNNRAGNGGGGGGDGGYHGKDGTGGGIRFVDGTFSLTGSTISQNSTNGRGGGISTSGGSNASVTSSTIFGNSSGDPGGGIHMGAGVLAITASTVQGNSTEEHGGGIYSDEGDLTIIASVFHDNSAGGGGGGIYNDEGNLTVNASTIDNNFAVYYGGGIASDTDSDFSTTQSQIINSTVSANVVSTGGGGIYNLGGLTVIAHCTVTANMAVGGQGSGVASQGYAYAKTQVSHTIISGNTGGDDVAVRNSTTNSFVSGGYNLIGTGNTFSVGQSALDKFNKTGDRTGIINPRLGPLQNNGGPTFTHAPLLGSPAINAGNPAATPGTSGVPLNDRACCPTRESPMAASTLEPTSGRASPWTFWMCPHQVHARGRGRDPFQRPGFRFRDRRPGVDAQPCPAKLEWCGGVEHV